MTKAQGWILVALVALGVSYYIQGERAKQPSEGALAIRDFHRMMCSTEGKYCDKLP
ncbi:hypothetical protein [Paracoccus aminophilus]|uniref:hypothetical protein n=1 Tax=Paracoccus aminophilus TaxID=34003 RepID=UPI00130EDB57|nr:hypothetical protein [Paracoccus aminophilus]